LRIEQIKVWLKKYAAVALLKGSGLALAYILNLVLANVFGAKLLGSYVLLSGVFIVISKLIAVGTNSITLRVFSSTDGDFEKSNYLINLFFVVLITSGLLYVVFLNFGEELANKIGLALGDLEQVFKVAPFFVVSSNFLEADRAKNRKIYYAFFSMVSQSLCLLFLVGLNIVLDWNIELNQIFIWSLLIVGFGQLILSSQVRGFVGHDTKFKVQGSVVKSIFRQGIPLFFASSSALLMQWIDQFTLGYYFENDVVAIYFSSVKVALLGYLPAVVINTVVAPKIAGAFANSRFDELQEEVVNGGKLSFLGSIPLVVIVTFWGRELLGLFGDQFVEGYAMLLVMVIAQLVNSITASVGYCLELTGHHDQFMKILLFGAGLNLMGNLLLVPSLGGLGAAVSTGFSLVVVNLLFVYFVKRNFSFIPLPFFK
jgi:O-antigen/teichoic acid export membrane protein